MNENPFEAYWDTPFHTPPFHLIKWNHYLPAFENAVKDQQLKIQDIIDQSDAPSFANTIEALEYSGEKLSIVSGVFYNILHADTDEKLQQTAKQIAPMISGHRDDIMLNHRLFERVQAVYQEKENLSLDNEEAKLLKETYKRFVRGGAGLGITEKGELRKINEALSLLSLQFAENVLKETNQFELILENHSDLAGLPDSVIKAASETARERGKAGKWVFTTKMPSMIPFLKYAENRNLRQKLFEAYVNRGNHDDELDNKGILSKIAALRVKRAALLGFQSHAHFVLQENMAKTPENVYSFLNKLWQPAVQKAGLEAAEMQDMIDQEGSPFKLMPWDWRYYAEKIKKARYDLDENELRPYFKLENVTEGVFILADKLWGIQFRKRKDIPVYHKDVQVFEVTEKDGTHIGILYADYFPRPGKQGGAWMNNYRDQYVNVKGKNITPIICNVGNFSKPESDCPALISLDETLTLFHEFGHALHGLLSKCRYPSLSGTSVARDFVELPSQMMENWALEPEMLKIYARHYKTNHSIPNALIKKIQNARKFNQGFAATEYLAASYLDMDWHTITEPVEKDPPAFEEHSMRKAGLIPEIFPRYRSVYFQHIFSGGYSAGYYSYIWAELLDTDAFEAFRENGIFDKKTAASFRKNILEKGGTADPMDLYINFRGARPDVKPLLKKRGLI